MTITVVDNMSDLKRTFQLFREGEGHEDQGQNGYKAPQPPKQRG